VGWVGLVCFVRLAVVLLESRWEKSSCGACACHLEMRLECRVENVEKVGPAPLGTGVAPRRGWGQSAGAGSAG
jgi:hypothetical protein